MSYCPHPYLPHDTYNYHHDVLALREGGQGHELMEDIEFNNYLDAEPRYYVNPSPVYSYHQYYHHDIVMHNRDDKVRGESTKERTQPSTGSDAATIDAAMTLLSMPQQHEQQTPLLSPLSQSFRPTLIPSRVTPNHSLHKSKTQLSCIPYMDYNQQAKISSFLDVSQFPRNKSPPSVFGPNAMYPSLEYLESINDSMMIASPPPIQSKCNLAFEEAATSFSTNYSSVNTSHGVIDQTELCTDESVENIKALTCKVTSTGNKQVLHQQDHPRPSNQNEESFSLALSEDEDVLSPLHCFIRKHCIEAFVVKEDTDSKLKRSIVGIRCIHCNRLPVKSRAERAVCYPSTIRNIYYSMETWQRRHALVCNEIPSHIKRELATLIKTSRSFAGGRRKYWSDAAKKLGMIDSPSGIRLAKILPNSISQAQGFQDASEQSCTNNSGVVLCTPEDKDLVTPFLFELISQMESCKFTEEDRSGGRSKVKSYIVGYPGLQCRHCNGKAGFGRYFPSSVDSMTLANSDRNIYNHMMKCRKCPLAIKERLEQYQESMQRDKDDGSSHPTKSKRGSRKTFFNRIWERLHSQNS